MTIIHLIQSGRRWLPTLFPSFLGRCLWNSSDFHWNSSECFWVP